MTDRMEALELELREAEERASRANERARQAEEAYRKVQMELVGAKDETEAIRAELQTLVKKVAALEAERAASRPASKHAEPAKGSELRTQVDSTLKRIVDLRDMLSAAAIELSSLHAEEVALGAKRTRVLSDACALLARAVGETGQAPPPIPHAASVVLDARMQGKPVMDISEVAELIESLRPPPPKGE